MSASARLSCCCIKKVGKCLRKLLENSGLIDGGVSRSLFRGKLISSGGGAHPFRSTSITQISISFSLHEKCPNTEIFVVRIFLYLDWMQENTDQKNSVFGHFSRIAYLWWNFSLKSPYYFQKQLCRGVQSRGTWGLQLY